MTTPRPLGARALAEARHTLVSDLTTTETDPGTLLAPGASMHTMAAHMATQNTAGLQEAALFHITTDASILAGHAAPDLPPSYRPPAEDIPAMAGLLAWEHPQAHLPDLDTAERLPVVAASWHLGPGRAGVWGALFTLYTHATPATRPTPQWRAPLVPARVGSLRLGDGTHPEGDPWTHPDPDTDHAVRVLLTTWLLMHQGATEATAEAAPERTRMARTLTKRGRPLPSVHVIDLHQATTPSGTAPSGRTVAVRYAVRGHWRQQPYGEGRRLRRPVWVHPHVRGPEGAPWSTATTVTRVTPPPQAEA